MPNYESIKALNWSRLRLLERSPTHFKAGLNDDSASLALGVATHCAILEPAKFQATFTTYPGKVRRGKEWDAFEFDATSKGLTVLSGSEHTKVIAMRNAVHAHPWAIQYLKDGKAEVSATWKILKRDCKGRLDYVRPDMIIDLKTTQSSHPKAFAYSATKYGYYGQAAWYVDGLARATGRALPYYILAVESDEPHVVTVFQVSDEHLAYGREQYQTLLAQLDYCEKMDFWGGYSEDLVCQLPPPEVRT